MLAYFSGMSAERYRGLIRDLQLKVRDLLPLAVLRGPQHASHQQLLNVSPRRNTAIQILHMVTLSVCLGACSIPHPPQPNVTLPLHTYYTYLQAMMRQRAMLTYILRVNPLTIVTNFNRNLVTGECSSPPDDAW